MKICPRRFLDIERIVEPTQLKSLAYFEALTFPGNFRDLLRHQRRATCIEIDIVGAVPSEAPSQCQTVNGSAQSIINFVPLRWLTLLQFQLTDLTNGPFSRVILVTQTLAHVSRGVIDSHHC
jgi:hypothetical protein